MANQGSEVNNPPPTYDVFKAASQLLNERIRARSGAERNAIARGSKDPALRHAVAIVEAFWDAREREKQAGQTLHVPVSQPLAPASPAPAPRPSYATMYAQNRRHGADGKFVSRAHVQRFEPARRIIRDSNEGGAS